MIKLFEQFNEYNQVKDWLDKYSVKDYTINEDLTVDVQGDVYLVDKGFDNIPINFRNVYGDFDCGVNNLTTLKGSPIYTQGDFSCGNNKLTSLEHCPTSIGGDFYCNYNHITSLKYCPKIINGDFSCGDNDLTSLRYSPEVIKEKFFCDYNKLTSLRYGPIEIGSYINFSENPLPEEIINLKNVRLRINLFKYQENYGIWNSDDTLNIDRFNIFLSDYKDNKLE